MGFLSGILGAATGFLTGGPAGAVIGGVGGLLSGKEQKKQQQQADNASNQSLALQQQQLDEAKKRREDYEASYKPIEDQLLASVRKGINPNYEQITNDVIGDVNTQFAGEETARLRQMQRMGVNPNSGRADALGRQLSLSRGLALAGGINKARRTESNRAEELTYARQSDAVQVGVNKLNGAQTNINSASTALSKTYAERANQSQTNANDASKSWADLGGTVYKAWDQYKNKPAKTTVGTGVWM